MATVEIQNKLWILGGSNDNFDGLQSSEFLTSSGTSSGPTLPEKVESHCVTSLSETKVMIIGGEIPHFVDGKTFEKLSRQRPWVEMYHLKTDNIKSSFHYL